MRLVVRADGSATIGLGHVMRSLAVAQVAAAQGHDVSFVMHDDGDGAGALPERHGFAVHRLADPDERGWLDDVAAGDRVVFDGYPFLTNGVTADARSRGARVAVVDDHDGGDVEADIVVNPNTVEPERYTRAARACCGPAYALVRPEFLRYRRPRNGAARTLLVTLGGSDAGGITDPVLDALDTLEPPDDHDDDDDGLFERVVLVAGPAAPETRERDWLEVVRDPPDVAATFDVADVALSAAGSTTWELLCMGVPVALVEVAPNQRLVAATAARSGAALVLAGVADVADAMRTLTRDDVRDTLGRRALATVDGRGAVRVVDALTAD
jgi:spore coat polysaccharide biosynthesis predicted glycosyltransferase SpsG